jgi:peroxiredoxin Q/BCP
MEGENTIGEGAQAPDICLPDKDGKEVCLSALKGKWVVLYFYPKDNTSGCTKEALDFSANLDLIQDLGATVIGVSPDSCKSHLSFASGKGLRFTLLSDESHISLASYDVWKKKSMYGRQYMGVERSTFIIDPEGKVHKAWRKVKVEGHVQEVLEALQEALSKTERP